jgi:hypothetical protein
MQKGVASEACTWLLNANSTNVAHAGKRRGFDLNLLSAYQQLIADIAKNIVDIYVVYWIISHSPSPDNEGGCRYNDLSWGKRKREFDDMSWDEAKKAARKAAGEREYGHEPQRGNDFRDMLGAAGTMLAAAFQPDSADEYENQVGGLYSEED